SGTDRWASSSGRNSQRAPSRWPKRSPAPRRFRSLEGRTPRAPCRSWGSPTRCPGCPPGAAQRWSCWKARSDRVSGGFPGAREPAVRSRTLALIAGNWKMHKGPTEAAEFCLALRDQDLDGVDVVVCPPYVSLAVAVQMLAGTEIAVAAQNVHWEDEGPYTGEISARMLRELGVYGAIVGHSERRQYFGEMDETVGKRGSPPPA